jgi:hypothetical protein
VHAPDDLSTLTCRHQGTAGHAADVTDILRFTLLAWSRTGRPNPVVEGMCREACPTHFVVLLRAVVELCRADPTVEPALYRHLARIASTGQGAPPL